MAKLTYHRSTKVAAAHPNYIRVTNLPRCRLRLINMNNDTDSCLMTCEILDKNQGNTTFETIALFEATQSIGAGVDVGWEGDIELGPDQDLRFWWEDTIGVAPTAGDVLTATVGFEML